MESQPQNPEFRNNPETFTHDFVPYLHMERSGHSTLGLLRWLKFDAGADPGFLEMVFLCIKVCVCVLGGSLC